MCRGTRRISRVLPPGGAVVGLKPDLHALPLVGLILVGDAASQALWRAGGHR
ncbi:MAG: hypothetical protein WC091_04670 [Sulfuricellaceae bacterium]